MKPTFTLRVPTNGFTFKPAVIKPKRIPTSHKPLTKILYCLATKDENNQWIAKINTKGIEDYEEVTILPFTEKSFELKGRTDVFYHQKDKYGHWVRIIRTIPQAEDSPGNPQTYCTLCENCVFSGHIVKVNGITQFDMSLYQGTSRECSDLLTIENKIKKHEEE